MKLASVFVVLVGAACGSVINPGVDGGGDVDGGSGAPVRLDVAFPPANGITDGSTIVVRGTAAAPDGIVALRVNGVAALTDDDFATWTATVPLVSGANELVVELEDRLGDIVSTSRTLTVSPNPLASPGSVAADILLLSTQPLFVGDDRLRAIIAIDRSTGARTLVTGQGRGAGPQLTAIRSIAFDPQNNRVIASGDGIFAVDVATGNRTTIATSTQFDALTLDSTRAFVIVRGILAADSIEAVNLATGARTTISAVGTGTGPAFMRPVDLVFDPFGNRLLVVDEGLDAVIAVNLANGNRTILSSAAVGGGPLFDRPAGITLEIGLQTPTQAWVVDAAQRAVIRIDLATGARSVVSSDQVGGGDPLVDPKAIAFTSAGDLAVTDVAAHAVVRITPANGARTLVSSSRAGTGPAHTLPFAAALVGDGVVLTDLRGVFRFDATTGARSQLAPSSGDVSTPSGVLVEADNANALFAVASGNLARIAIAGGAPVVLEGSGPVLPRFSELAFDASGNVIAGGDASVLRVDPVTGARSLVSNASRGTGPALGAVTGIGVDGDRVIALDASLDAVLAIDAVTGNRLTLSNATTGSGPVLVDPSGLAISGDTAFVVDSNLEALVGVSLASGNRTVISDATTPGPSLVDPHDVDVDAARGLAFVTDRSLGLFAIDLATGHRVIVSH